ncbi:hypothetical protein ACI6PS_03280 [Flavobacterium sp. PLA-1-15]|uniref:hypothetical protein n=1 Tax=Flavobacterium sp. PLA-1-15 TaxID=3380533 RepID=UPI003B7A5CD0
MSERWKYQLKVGLPWGIFMTVFMAIFNMDEKPLTELVQTWFFYFQMAMFLVVGVFILGYSSWKSKIRREANK